MVKLNLSKLDAARKQINQAIDLYFRDGDEVSTHTLVSAGSNVIRDLMKEKQLVSSRERMLTYIKPDKRADYIKLLQRPYNFYKHADKDPESILTHDTDITERDLFLAITDFGEYTGKITKEMELYCVWYIVHHPDFIDRPQTPEVKEYEKEAKYHANKVGKASYYEHRYEFYSVSRAHLGSKSYLPQYGIEG